MESLRIDSAVFVETVETTTSDSKRTDRVTEKVKTHDDSDGAHCRLSLLFPFKLAESLRK
jgi:hypothetical protein